MSHFQSTLKNLDKVDKNLSIALVVWEFNRNYTQALEDATIAELTRNGFKNIDTFIVPWAFEIPGFVRRILEDENKDYYLIITLGVVVRWDTPHFDYVCAESARGLMDLTLLYDTAIINGILTCNTEEQVQERIGGGYAISGMNLLAEINKIYE